LATNLNQIVVSLDGASKGTFEYYRQGANFFKILKNIENLCYLKTKKPEKFPIINLQFLVMKKNEKEIQKIKKLSKKLGVDVLTLKFINLWHFEPNQDELKKKAEEFLPQNKGLSRFSPEEKRVSLASVGKCPFLESLGVFLWNGDLTLCCFDPEGKYRIGNINNKNYDKLRQSQKFKKYQELMEKKDLPICRFCFSSRNKRKKLIFFNKFFKNHPAYFQYL